VQRAASAIIGPDGDRLPAYRLFHEAVTRAQLAAWLPRRSGLLVDVSGPRAPAAQLAAAAGHTVLRVTSEGTIPAKPALLFSPGGPIPPDPPWEGSLSPRTPSAPPRTGGLPTPPYPPGIIPLVADPSRLAFLGDGCADGVIADDRALSVNLAAEAMVAEIARVLRPAGRVLACVDSLVLGMAALADQHRWANLVDLPHADVVLVPWPDGTITRCYGPDQARELFTGAGLAVESIRPRTVFSESMVTHLLRRDPASMDKLVRAELAAHCDDSLGAQLVICARKEC
jgi:hypothetical protein